MQCFLFLRVNKKKKNFSVLFFGTKKKKNWIWIQWKQIITFSVHMYRPVSTLTANIYGATKSSSILRFIKSHSNPISMAMYMCIGHSKVFYHSIDDKDSHRMSAWQPLNTNHGATLVVIQSSIWMANQNQSDDCIHSGDLKIANFIDFFADFLCSTKKTKMPTTFNIYRAKCNL